MATSADGIETVGEVAGTTPYDYEAALPCEKSNVKELAAQFLPPLYSLVFMTGLLGNVTKTEEGEVPDPERKPGQRP